ncbi:MAG: DinB family protein [Terriglobales bacterium]
MATLVDVLRNHLNYTAWASSRLVEAASALNPQELMRDFATADHNVLGTLVHVYAADRIWLGRIEGNPPARFLDLEQDMQLGVLRREWPALLERWKQWGALLTEDSIDRNVSYKSTKGDAFVTPTWQIVLHVVNHATHHRGQVSGFLRAMGHVPPSLELTAFYREALR